MNRQGSGLSLFINMECLSCKTLKCCPEHCCDWDSCQCKDCESCGGEGMDKPVLEPTAGPSTPITLPDPPKPPPKPTLSVEQSITDYIQEKVKESLKAMREQEAKEQAENDAKRKAERARHDEILAASRETLAKNKIILESTQGTLDRLQSTIQGIKETEKKFQDFQDAFNKAMKDKLEQCLGTDDYEEMKEKYGSPRPSSIEEVGQVLSQVSSVAFILGAGVSSESGVFMYKGNEETWDIEGNSMKLTEVMDLNILQSSPLEFWQAVQYNRMRVLSCCPNPVHFALTEFLGFWRSIGRSVKILTQNFDGFERWIVGQDPDLYEINGNLHEMRCLFECGNEIFPSVEVDDMLYSIPLCPQCSAIARPNFYLTGDSMNEVFYKSDSAAQGVEMAEALVVIGTQLNRDFVWGIVQEFAKTGKIIVEINIEPVIEYGNVLVLPARCIEVVPPIVEVVKSILS